MVPVSNFIIDLAIGINFFLGITFTIGKRSYLQLIGILFFIISYISFHLQLLYTKQLFYAPHLFLTYVPPLLFFGPIAFYVVIRHLQVFEFKKRDFLIHFILPVFVTIMLIPIFLMDNDNKIEIINSLYYDSIIIEYYVISFTCVLSILFYFVLLFRYLPSIRLLISERSTFQLILLFFVVGGVLSLFSFASILFHSLTFLYIGNFIFSLTLIFLYCLYLRNRNFLSILVQEVKLNKQRQTYLQGINIERVLANLNYFMHDEEVYKDPDLSLQSMADLVNLSIHQLSELINHELGKNFSTYVMEYRVKAAIEELKNNEHSTILSIALSVGFNSNSAFYSAFRKITGKSPKEFRT